jgi:hypothetical protein
MLCPVKSIMKEDSFLVLFRNQVDKSLIPQNEDHLKSKSRNKNVWNLGKLFSFDNLNNLSKN